jgi:hypothetical protein
MTSQTLSAMGHHDLVNHVQTRITGTPSSTYVRHAGTPAVKITPYPKRRRPAALRPRHSDGPSYADFFVPAVAGTERVHVAA